jgi:hypothetical protein
MKIISLFGFVWLFTVSATFSYGQNPRTILAPGQPSLTQEMVDRLESVYDSILDIRLSPAQRTRFQKGVVVYWTTHNTAGIDGSLSNLKYFGSADELASLKSSSQKVIIESLRRDIQETGDDVSRVLVEAFDGAHGDLRDATRAKTFADLTGTWKQTDFLLADKNSYGGQVGSGYTDTSVLEIKSDGSYKLIKVHDHYGSTCSRRDASTEQGIVSAKGTGLVFQVQGGSSEITDGCVKKTSRSVIKPHVDTFVWSIRPNPEKENVATLCISTGKDTAACYERQ